MHAVPGLQPMLRRLRAEQRTVCCLHVALRIARAAAVQTLACEHAAVCVAR
jgi:hypothetical protein